MTSQINATVPVFGSPTTESVRQNFLIAYNEITALQLAGASLSSGVIGAGSVTPTPPFGSLFLNANNVAPPGGLPPGFGPNLYIIGANGVDTGEVIDSFGSGVNSSLTFRHASGTAAAPTAIMSGDILGYLVYAGRGASSYSGQVNIGVAASENWTDTARGAYLSIATTPAGSLAAVVSLTVAGNEVFVPGVLAVGQAATAPPNNGCASFNANTVAPPAGLGGNIAVTSLNNGFGIISIDVFGTSVVAEFVTRTARGTAAAPTALQNNDSLGSFNCLGRGATSYSTQAGVSMFATENWTDTARGAQIILQTTPAGSTGLVGSLALSGNTATFSGLVDVGGGTVQLFAVGGGHQWLVTTNPTGFAIGDQTLGVDRLQIDNLGACTASSAWGVISDATLKTDIEDHPYGLFEVMQLRPRRFRMVDDDRAGSGLIAQELEEIMPELVSMVGSVKTVRETGVIWPLINAIKELKAELDQIKAKVGGYAC